MKLMLALKIASGLGDFKMVFALKIASDLGDFKMVLVQMIILMFSIVILSSFRWATNNKIIWVFPRIHFGVPDH